MKYVVTWHERAAASYADYEAAQERVLGVFKNWKMPGTMTIHEFLVRVGEYGGYMVVETERPADIHFLTSTFAVFQFKVEPVMEVMDAVAVEIEAIAWRKKNAG